MLNKKLQTANRHNQVGSFTKVCIAVTTILAMFAYSAFPLAIFFNKPYFWHGLVSGLSEPGQPHNLLFTSIDTTASLFGMMFFSYLSWREDWDRPQAIALGLVVVACLAELLTDVYTLPSNFSTTGGIPSAHYFASHLGLIVHLAASSVNSVAFVASFGLWVLHRRHTKSSNLFRELMFAITLCIGIFGTIVGHVYPGLSPTLQRIFILCYCYWFIAFPFDSLTLKRRRPVVTHKRLRATPR
jgi:hypothetical protein